MSRVGMDEWIVRMLRASPGVPSLARGGIDWYHDGRRVGLVCPMLVRDEVGDVSLAIRGLDGVVEADPIEIAHCKCASHLSI